MRVAQHLSKDRASAPPQSAYTFERFIKGHGNDLACSACQAAAESPGGAYNPLFIYGSVGLGKTHLLYAIANEVERKRASYKVIYITSERFAIELIQSLRKGCTDKFRRTFRHTDILLIDDVHFLQSKEAIEEELFHTFNELHDSGRQIVLSSDRPPEELAQMQERLISRFRWGMVADIQPPDYETRLAILTAKAEECGLDIDYDVLSLIANRVTSSVRALEGALTRVAAYTDLQGASLERSRLAHIIAQDPQGEQPVNINLIKTEVARSYGVSARDLEGKKREKRISQARHIAMYLARELTKSSYPTIAEAFGRRDHTTAMHAFRKVKQMAETPIFRSEIEGLKRRLNGHK